MDDEQDPDGDDRDRQDVDDTGDVRFDDLRAELVALLDGTGPAIALQPIVKKLRFLRSADLAR